MLRAPDIALTTTPQGVGIDFILSGGQSLDGKDSERPSFGVPIQNGMVRSAGWGGEVPPGYPVAQAV